jgi:3-methyladenine DNA glycosylase AlkD
MAVAQTIEKALRKLGSVQKAKASAWFFKTKKGQYGYGDVFYGVTVPEQRRVARMFYDVPQLELKKLLQNKVHECRLTALLILVDQYKQGDKKEKQKIVSFYLKNLKYVNNWDLVDSSASYILGDYLSEKRGEYLYTLAQSKNMWERRVAIVATHAFIKRGEFTPTLAISKILLNDPEDLLHKASGWMLREVGKKDVKTLEAFLGKYAPHMPRTMLRYAIERFSAEKRKKYLAIRPNAILAK